VNQQTPYIQNIKFSKTTVFNPDVIPGGLPSPSEVLMGGDKFPGSVQNSGDMPANKVARRSVDQWQNNKELSDPDISEIIVEKANQPNPRFSRHAMHAGIAGSGVSKAFKPAEKISMKTSDAESLDESNNCEAITKTARTPSPAIVDDRVPYIPKEISAGLLLSNLLKYAKNKSKYRGCSSDASFEKGSDAALSPESIVIDSRGQNGPNVSGRDEAYEIVIDDDNVWKKD
jgi:hypothetical protein